MHGGYPNSWMVYLKENSMNMDNLGYPYSKETSRWGMIRINNEDLIMGFNKI